MLLLCGSLVLRFLSSSVALFFSYTVIMRYLGHLVGIIGHPFRV